MLRTYNTASPEFCIKVCIKNAVKKIHLQICSFASFLHGFKYLKRASHQWAIWAKLFFRHQAYLCQLTYPSPPHARSALWLPVRRTEGKQWAGGFRELGACKEEAVLVPFLMLHYLEIHFLLPVCTLPFVAWRSPSAWSLRDPLQSILPSIHSFSKRLLS